MLLVTIKQLRLIADLGHGAVNCSCQNDAHTGTVLVPAGKHAKTRDAAWAKVQDVRRSGENGGLLPVDRITRNHADQGRDDVSGHLFPDVFASVGVIDGNA